MRRSLPLLLTLPWLLTACSGFESIPYSPPQTAETWLQIQPYAEFFLGARRIVLVQPSTSLIVYLLGLLTIGCGLVFLRARPSQEARRWWGIALLLWGLGALLAGTSYEAFSYDIKCAGRPACIWTSWWELAYLLVTVWSIDAMAVAVAYSSTTGRLRRAFKVYAAANAGIYSLLLAVGAIVPVPFLISFEFLLLVGAPAFLAFFAVNVWRYRRLRQALDLALVGAWLWLALTVAAYFAYYLSGLTAVLWGRGVWFSENDVLHLFLIVWMIYLAGVIAPRSGDLPDSP